MMMLVSRSADQSNGQSNDNIVNDLKATINDLTSMS